jgi:hypothetical protein
LQKCLVDATWSGKMRRQSFVRRRAKYPRSPLFDRFSPGIAVALLIARQLPCESLRCGAVLRVQRANLPQEKNMRSLKLAAIAAAAILAAGAANQVSAGVYDYPYSPTYESYPVSGPSSGPAPSYPSSYSSPAYAPTYAPSSTYGSSTDLSTGTGPARRCPSGNCGSCGANGGCCSNGGCCENGRCSSGCCANGRCGTCPPGACQSGNCPANCPNGHCSPSRNRDLSASFDGPAGPSYRGQDYRVDYAPPAPRYTPSSWSRSSAPFRNYDSGSSDRVLRDRELESPFYN